MKIKMVHCRSNSVAPAPVAPAEASVEKLEKAEAKKEKIENPDDGEGEG